MMDKNQSKKCDKKGPYDSIDNRRATNPEVNYEQSKPRGKSHSYLKNTLSGVGQMEPIYRADTQIHGIIQFNRRL